MKSNATFSSGQGEGLMIDWDAAHAKLLAASRAAIEAFTHEHPTEKVCSFFFDSEPCYGYVFISIDTLENSLNSAKKLERWAIRNQAKNLTGKITWQWAKYQLSNPRLSVYGTDIGDFKFQEFAQVDFSDWQRVWERGDYPKSGKAEDDWIDGNARILFWKVIEELVAENGFASMNLASPFMIGYGIHDEESPVLRILNWPKSEHGESSR